MQPAVQPPMIAMSFIPPKTIDEIMHIFVDQKAQRIRIDFAEYAFGGAFWQEKDLLLFLAQVVNLTNQLKPLGEAFPYLSLEGKIVAFNPKYLKSVSFIDNVVHAFFAYKKIVSPDKVLDFSQQKIETKDRRWFSFFSSALKNNPKNNAFLFSNRECDFHVNVGYIDCMTILTQSILGWAINSSLAPRSTLIFSCATREEFLEKNGELMGKIRGILHNINKPSDQFCAINPARLERVELNPDKRSGIRVHFKNYACVFISGMSLGTQTPQEAFAKVEHFRLIPAANELPTTSLNP